MVNSVPILEKKKEWYFWLGSSTDIPAGIWCENDVGSTSMRRHHVASTLIRRHFGTKCPLGLLRARKWYFGGNMVCFQNSDEKTVFSESYFLIKLNKIK